MLYRHWQLGSICVPLCPTGYEPARSIIPPNDARKHRLISQVIPAFLLDVGARLARAVVVKAGHRGPMRNGRSRTDMVLLTHRVWQISIDRVRETWCIIGKFDNVATRFGA
jgi:hypothetical protein